MNEVITIGVDLAKNVFQVHGVDAEGAVVVRRQLRRGQVLPFFKKQRPCLVGMEACATSHHWAREIEALGHQVRLMPPRYVKPYVKRNKNDMADAEAICEAVTRPTMRFVEIKTAGSAISPDAAPDPSPVCPSADNADQCPACPSGRVRYCRRGWSQWVGAVAEDHRGWR